MLNSILFMFCLNFILCLDVALPFALGLLRFYQSKSIMTSGCVDHDHDHECTSHHNFVLSLNLKISNKIILVSINYCRLTFDPVALSEIFFQIVKDIL